MAPAQPPVVEKPQITSETELAFWQSIKDSDDPVEYEAYLKEFPNGKFAPLAKIKIGKLKAITTGNIHVSGSPDGAQVYVNGDYVGKVPVSLKDIKHGSHELEVSTDGYETIKRRMNLASGESKKLNVRLVKAGPNETGRDGRFIAHDNGTVLDTKSGLMWAAKDNGGDINWRDAKRYCENYRGGGYSDWRMPTQDELASLYDLSKKNQRGYHVSKLIDISGYIRISQRS